ncbi:UbiA-like protein EboC [Algivirga pacifica]|uniref:UbiA family prenyltransferase n=1 Tax=Algivirga pacifica TaxID=1162670 RepID=A0ABP9DCP8_9BACT
MKQLKAYLLLMRPANIVTSVADILAGYWIAESLYGGGQEHWTTFFYLILSTIGLYGGGIVLNDVLDADLDRIERPERPIPSGKVKREHAMLLAFTLMAFGVMTAFSASMVSGLLAMMIVVSASAYNAWAKHHQWWGPLLMGTCRALNLWLGMSALIISFEWPVLLPLMSLAYIGAVTMLSQSEVYVDKQGGAIRKAILVFAIIFLNLLFMPFFTSFSLVKASPFIVLLTYVLGLPLIGAFVEPVPMNFRKAVKMGIMGLMVYDAALVAGFSSMTHALIIIALLPVVYLLGKYFSIT